MVGVEDLVLHVAGLCPSWILSLLAGAPWPLCWLCEVVLRRHVSDVTMVDHWGWGLSMGHRCLGGVCVVIDVHMQPLRRVQVSNMFAGRGCLVVRVPNPRVMPREADPIN